VAGESDKERKRSRFVHPLNLNAETSLRGRNGIFSNSILSVYYIII
jgi:hypothetical protein